MFGSEWQTCAAFCADYPYYGVEYGEECYCGDYTSDYDSAGESTGCDVACAGDSSLTCGGRWAIEVYTQGERHGSGGDVVVKLGAPGFLVTGCRRRGTFPRSRGVERPEMLHAPADLRMARRWVALGVDFRDAGLGVPLGSGTVQLVWSASSGAVACSL